MTTLKKLQDLVEEVGPIRFEESEVWINLSDNGEGEDLAITETTYAGVYAGLDDEFIFYEDLSETEMENLIEVYEDEKAICEAENIGESGLQR